MFWRVFIMVAVGILDAALFAKMLWGSGGIVEYRVLKRQYAAVQARIAELDASNMALSKEIRLLQTDNQYVEKMIRQKLRYLRDNEIVYLFPAQAEAQTGASPNDRKN